MQGPNSANIDIGKNNMFSVYLPGYLPLMFTAMEFIWGILGGLPAWNVFSWWML